MSNARTKKPKPAKGKHPGGRPTVYHPKFCKELIAFFDVEPWREVEVTTTRKDGSETYSNQIIANDLPTFAGFARKIGIHRETLLEWCERYPQFSDAYKKAKEFQDDILTTNAMGGRYASTYSIFFAKNALDDRYKDKTESDTRISGGLNLTNLLDAADEGGH